MVGRRVYDFLNSIDSAHIGLMVWLLAGKIWVAGWGEIPLLDSDNTWLETGWLFTGFAAPLMVIVAYAGLRWGSGRGRYISMWARLGGDVGQITIMVVFTINLLNHTFGDAPDDQNHHIFMAFFMGALLSFLAAMVVRDVLTIAVTERLAGRIRADE